MLDVTDSNNEINEIDESGDIYTARASLVLSLRQHGIVDPVIMKAFEKTPHENFVPKEYIQYAYKDKSLPLGFAQSMFSPVHLAQMIVALEPNIKHKMLEIGTGSGYSAAVLSRLVKRVFSVEIKKQLAHLSKENWQKTGTGTVIGFCENGMLGLSAHQPFDRIMLSGSVEKVPQILLDQLSKDGILVAAVGKANEKQIITKIERIEDKFITTHFGNIRISALINK